VNKLLAMSLALLPCASAIAATDPANPAQDIMQVKTLDEVVVTGRIGTLSGLTKAIHAAEDRFYERYNELNKDYLMDIQCRNEAPIRSNVKIRTCQPKAVDESTRTHALRLMSVTEGDVSVMPASTIRAMLLPEMKRRTLQMLNKDPQLRRALLEHARLVQMYDDLRARKFDGQFVVWD
jgi:hypothetical protein